MANAPRQQMNKWRGPATVVMVEQDKKKVQTYWLVHGTSLIRCAQSHVRPVIDSEPEDLRVNLDEAKKALQKVNNRSTTQYFDLTKNS